VTKRNLTLTEKKYDEARASLASRCDPSYLVDAPCLFLTRIQTTGILSRIALFEKVRKMPGSIVECGVFRGNSLMLLTQLSLTLEPYAINRMIYGFDTFEGFRSINSTNDPSDVDESTFADTNLSLLEELIALQDVVRPVSMIPRVQLIKGDLTSTAPEFVSQNPGLCISLLILDTDLYESTKVALAAFLPHMHKGAIVALDEVCYSKFVGETIALKEQVSLNEVKLQKFPFESSCAYFEL
jgi:hypothetical protein